MPISQKTTRLKTPITLPGRSFERLSPCALGSRAYRQIFFKPYRIRYRIRANTVFIAVIADGHRNMASLLARRLPGS
jgi:hypothetical protein